MEQLYTIKIFKHTIYQQILIWAFLMVTCFTSVAEGTAQLTPTLASDNQGVLQLWDNNDPARNSFTYGAPETKRLNFTICDPNEVVYFGMRYDTGDMGGTSTLWYRIIDPNNNQAFPATGWQQVTNTGAGSISSWAQAVAGPNTIVGGAGGYTPLSFNITPAMGGGDYYVEFFRKSTAGMPTVTEIAKDLASSTPAEIAAVNAGIAAQQKTKVRLRYFDLTITNGAGGTRIPGRLFSKTWDINVNAANSPFIATMYVYANDGIVTGLNFNRIRPFGFTIACNATGVANTGNTAVDRRSTSTNSTYADYKIFLNDPDQCAYGTGIFGDILNKNNITVTGCDVNNRCINIVVDKAGGAELLLNFNGVPGYQFGTTDVLIKQTLVIGSNCIPWNSRDGLGNLITPGTPLDMRLDYFNGITHLPLFDVENHPYGYIVSLVRPAGPPPLLFWDDTGIPGGTSNLSGCTTGVPTATSGCHGFGSVTSGTTPASSNPTTNDWGNNRTINTWWYANYINVNAVYNVPGSIAVDANTGTPGTGSANDINSCTNAGPIQLNGAVTGATGGRWSIKPGVTGTFANINSPITTFTPSTADLALSSIYLYLTSTGNGGCPSVKDSIKVTFIGGPTVSAGAPQSACANNPTLTLNGNFTVAPGIRWTGGAGTFVPNNTTKNATYTPTAAEITAGSITLTITTTGSTLCPEATDNVTLTYTPAPTVNAGSAVSVCANNPVASLVGTATNQTAVIWSGGTGIFGTSGSTSTTYTPSAAEINAAPTSVTLTLTASKAGCNSVTSNVNVSITPRPTVNAGTNRTICKNDSVNLAGTVTVATGGVWSGGSGKFTPNANTLTANYKPSTAELAGTSLVLTLTTTGNGLCTPVQSQMTITFSPTPTALVSGPTNVCANNPVINLSSVVTGATVTGQLWLGSGGSFIPGNTAKDVTYTPTPTEISSGFAGIVLQTTGGICPPVYDTLIVSFGPAPTVDAGLPISICENNPTGALTGSSTGGPVISWSSPTGGLFSAPTTVNPTYTATAADITAGSVTLTITAKSPTCNPVTDQVVVTITPPPTVSAGPARSTCRNNPTATFNGSFNGSTGVQWTTTGDGTFGSSTSAVSTYTAGPNDLIAGTVTLRLTTTGNGKCNPVSATTTMTFTPVPVVVAGTYTVCSNNAPVSLNGSVTIATGGRWVGGAGSFSPSRNVLNPVYTPTSAEISAGTLNLTLQSTGNGNCNVVSSIATITFSPAPTVTPITPVNVCADFPAATISATRTLATGILWSGGTGSIANTTAASTTYTPSLSEITAGTASLTVTTTGNGTCSPVSANVTILIAPAPTVNAGSNQIVCGTVSTVSNLSGTVTGATGGTWSIVTGNGTFGNANNTSTTYTPSNQDVINGSVTLKLTSTGNGLCQPVSNTMTISYTPVPSINAGADQIVCSTELPISLSATGSPAVWAASAGVYGNVNSLATTYTPSAGEIAAGTVTLTINTIASGACPVKTSQITITIPGGPIVNPGPANQTMCGSLAAYQLTGIVTNATGGIWTTNGTGSFLPNANTLNATYSPSATDRANGSVILTLTSTGNGFCKQVARQITLTITPPITVSAGPNQTFCADAGGFALNGTVAVATGGIWSITSGSGSITTPTSLSTTYTPSAGDLTTGSVSLLLTSTGNGGCPAVTSAVTFTITPAPTLTIPSNLTICGDSAYVQLSASFTVATGVAWTTSGTGAFTPNATTPAARYIPSATDIAAGNVTLTARTTGNGICNPVVRNVTITITPIVTLTAGSNQTVCENNSIVNLNAITTVASAVNWTTNGTGTFANQTAPATTYTPSVADIAGGLVTLTVKTTGNGSCKAKTGQVQITIKPAPIVNAGLPQTLCADVSAISLNGTVTNAGGGTWTSNGTGTFANANALTTTYTPTQADTSAGSVIFTLTSTGNGTCTPVSKMVTVTFKKLPIVVAGPNQTICGDSTYIQLAGKVTNAGGGVWSRSGSGVFFPSTIDLNAVYSISNADRAAGTVVLTLTSTTNGACPAQKSNLTLIITPAPIVTISADKTVCANSAVISASGTFTTPGATGLKWTTSGTGTFSLNNTSPNITYTPSAIDKAAGSVVLAITTTGNGTCKPAQGHLTLTITPAPTLEAGFNKTICADSLGVLLNEATVTTAAGVSWSTNGSGVFGPNNTTLKPTYFPSAADITAGLVKLAAVTTGNGLCLAVRDTIQITITPKPTVNAGTDISICADTGGVVLNGNSTIAGGVRWTSSGTGIFVPSALVKNAEYIPSNADTTAKNITLTLTTTNNGTCKPVADQVNISIAPVPVVNAGSDRTVCADVDQLLLGGKVLNATGGIWTTSGSGTFDPNNTSLNPNYTPSLSDLTVGTVALTLRSTGNGLCNAVSDNVNLQFNPVATISAGNNLQVCNSVPTVTINASGTNLSNVSWIILSGSGSLSSASTLSTTYTVNAADVVSGSVTLRITGTALSGCSNVMDDVVITFVAAPPIDAGTSKTVCSTDLPIKLDGTGSSAKWSGYNGTFNPNDETLNALYTPSASEISAGTVTLTLTTINNGVCAAATDNVTYTIIPGPVVNAGTVPKICANSPNVNLSGTSNGIGTGVIWSTSGSGIFANGTTLTPSYTPSASDKNGGEVVLTISSTGHNTACKAATDTVRLFIAPAPKITVGSNQTVCGDATTVDVNSSFTNATGVVWSKITANGTFANSTAASTKYNVAVPADTTAGTITLQVSTTGQLTGCPSATAQMSITFTRPPKVNAGTPITVCTDTTSIPLNGSVLVASGGIWTSPSGGTFTPNAGLLNANYIPSAADKATGTVTLTLTTTGNGTCNAYTSNVLITLNPKPTLTGSVGNDSICTGNVITASANFTNAASIIWKTTGTGTFSTTTGTSTIYTPSTDDELNGGVIIYTSTLGSTPCKEIDKYYSVIILQSPASLVNAGFDQIACADAGFFPLNGTVGGLGGSGIWSSATGRGDFFPDATDLNPVFVADQADIDAGGLTITLTSTNNGICAPSFDDMILTITPAPTVTVGSDLTFCADTAFVQLNPTITNALGGEWSTTGTGIFSPSISDLNAVYVPSAADRTNGLVGISLQTTGNGTCNAYFDDLIIKLTPKPTLNIGPDKIVCADQVVDLSADITVASGVDWATSGAGIFTNPTSSITSQYIMFDADTMNKVFNIFAKTVNQGLCKPVHDTLKVTVQPVPVVITSSDQTVCADLNTIQISAGVANASSIEWSTNGSGSFTPNSTGSPVSYNFSPADITLGSVTLTATSANSGICSSRNSDLTVSVTPIPVVSAGAPIICDTLNGAALTGSIISGLTGDATWSSSTAGTFAVNNSTLNAVYYPTHADILAGKVTLTLTASNYGTCNAVTSTADLLIEPLPIANAGTDQFSCVGATITVEAKNREDGVNYLWEDETGTVVAPANSPSHTFVISGNATRVLVAENYKGCITRDTVQIATFLLPTYTMSPVPACYKENLLVQSNPSPQPTVPGLYQWFNNGSIMTGQDKTFLIVPDTGTYKIEFSYGNCSSSDQIQVRPVPIITASDAVACGNARLSATVSPATATINWSYEGTSAGSGSPISVSSIINDTIKYDIVATNPATGCSSTDSVYVIGLPVPEMISLDSTTCEGLQVRLTARPNNIPNLDQFLQVTFDWRKDGGVIFSKDSAIIVNSVGTYKGAVSIDQCKDTSTNVIAFAAYPVSSLPEEYVYCPDEKVAVTLDPGNQPTGTTFVWNDGILSTSDTLNVMPLDDTTYVVIITNQYNCSITDQTNVVAICAPIIKVPTAFTPDLVGSGNDQYFRGYGRYEQNYKMMVFNRWGEVIFVTNDKNTVWDGNYLGQPAPSGVYPWIVTYEGRRQFKGPYKQTGQVTIIR